MSPLNVTRILKFGTLTAVLMLSAISAQAQGRGGHHGGQDGAGGMMDGHVERMLETVDATKAQLAQIKQIMLAARTDLKAQHDGSRKLYAQSLALYAAPNIDAAAIEVLRQQTQAQHEVASKRMSQAMVEAARVLTPEQRAKFAEKMKQRQARMAEHSAAKHGS